MRILVVEDEAGIADFLRRGLESDGYAVTWAADGEEGEALALSGEFDLVLLDVMLPGRDGLEVLASVRRSLPSTARDPAHRSRPGRGSRSRPRFGGDRLRDQAVLLRRARGPDARAPSPSGRGRTGPPGSRWATSRSTLCGAVCGGPGSRSASRRPSSTCLLSSPVIPTRCSPAGGSSRPSGATTSTRARTCSACTSATCGGSSPARGQPGPDRDDPIGRLPVEDEC